MVVQLDAEQRNATLSLCQTDILRKLSSSAVVRPDRASDPS